jgi:ribosomal protein S27AE
MELESSKQRCPRCHRRFVVLADEEGQHSCPYCGYSPWERDEDEGEDGGGE